MNKLQYFGVGLSGLGIFLLIGWGIWKFSEAVDLPLATQIALYLIVGGIIIVLASLIYERSKDVKKEDFG
ncbi:MAG: hypothetical protein ACXQTP_03250 [Candidatus Methanofastidiosia archaeon]